MTTATHDWVKAGNFAASHFTPDQGRVLYHMERIFRSTGGGIRAHAEFLALCKAEDLPAKVNTWTLSQCVRGLQLIERASRVAGLHWFRDVSTQWEPLALRLAQQTKRAGAFQEVAHV